MKSRNIVELEFEIDKLTNSIENALTGEIFETNITQLLKDDIRQIKKADWVFDWLKELKTTTNHVYKLTTLHNDDIIHGLISITDKNDHIFMALIESARFNKGKNKQYKGVAGNLVAFCCKFSFEKGYDGVVSFVAKTKLIEHYKYTLGAKQFGVSNRMYIDTKEAIILVKQYFKDFKND